MQGHSTDLVQNGQSSAARASVLDLVAVASGILALACAPLLRQDQAVFYVGLIPAATFAILWLLQSRRRTSDRFSAFVAVGSALVSLVFPVGFLFVGPAALFGAGLITLGLGRREPREWAPGVLLAAWGYYALGGRKMHDFVTGTTGASVVPYLVGAAVVLAVLALWISKSSRNTPRQLGADTDAIAASAGDPPSPDPR